ncbi:MAG TPA: hypothetical protein VII55_02970 [Candidatus Saccharimonadales bacterium]
MAAKDKDTIYIDIDDEITGIIDKLKVSEGKVVALVLPKRASVFQSIVNMKLLKRAADSDKKNLVLITSEAGLLPLAGAAGVHVAKTLTSKPEIPLAPDAFNDAEETVQEDGEAVETPLDTDKTLGELAGAGGAAAAADGVETLTLDNEDLAPEAAGSAIPGGSPETKTFEPAAKSKAKKNKKLRIPNFNRFRLLLVIGGLLLLLIIGILILMTVASKATINIKTDATNVNTNLNLNLSTTAKTLDAPSDTIPAKLASQQKTYTQQVPTTGQKNNGTKASGSVVLTNCSQANDITVPAGTGLSSGGNTYISQQTVTVPASDFQKGKCKGDGQATVSIMAQNPGSSYNGATSFTVAGQSEISAAPAGQIAGGTDNIVQIVNQNDINTAKSKITPSDSNLKQTLDTQLKADNYYPLDATYVAGTPAVTSSSNVGDVANNVTVTETITYTMFGVKQNDLNTLLNDQINTQIDTGKQAILDNGLSQGVFNVNNISAAAAQLSLSTKATAGPDLNVDNIKQQAAGKHVGAIKSQLSNNPDVTSVDVTISPFWISSAPKKTSRITVNIAKPTTTKASTSSGSGH